jgi:spermidine synthase
VFAPIQLTVAFLLPRLFISALLIAPPTIALGTIFPSLIAEQVEPRSALESIGWLLAVNTIGAICGALVFGMLLIPSRAWTSGMEFSLIIAILLLSILGVFAHTMFLGQENNWTKDAQHTRFRFIALTAVACLLLFGKPSWNTKLMSLGPSFVHLAPGKTPSFLNFLDLIEKNSAKIVFYREGSTSTVTVEENVPNNVIYLKNNGKVESALPLDWRMKASTSDASTQMLLGMLPVLANKRNDLSVLVIGLGTGITSGAILENSKVKTVKICELEPAVVEAEKFFEKSNLKPLRWEWISSGRSKLIEGDARTRLSSSPESYDVVVCQPSEPWISGSSDLYTHEFWQLTKSRLKQDGILCQWLQLYCIDKRDLSCLLKTFVSVFQSGYVFHPKNSGEILLLGLKSADPKIDLPGLADLKESGPPKSFGIKNGLKLDWDLTVSFAHLRAALGGDDNFPLNTDSNLMTEYQLPTDLLLDEQHLVDNLQYLSGICHEAKVP